jgi:hypothetical protein
LKKPPHEKTSRPHHMTKDTSIHKSGKKYVNVYMDATLAQAIQDARDSGRRYKGKLASYTLCIELGAGMLLGIKDNEADIIQQKLDDLDIKQSLIESERTLLREQLANVKIRQVAEIREIDEERQTVQQLADEIVKLWDQILLKKQKQYITYLVGLSPKLEKDKVEAIFPSRYQPAPAPDRAFQIAGKLLGYSGVGTDA